MHQLECRAGVDDDLCLGIAPDGSGTPCAERRTKTLASGQHQSSDLRHRVTKCGVECGPTFEFGREHRFETSCHPVGGAPGIVGVVQVQMPVQKVVGGRGGIVDCIVA